MGAWLNPCSFLAAQGENGERRGGSGQPQAPLENTLALVLLSCGTEQRIAVHCLPGALDLGVLVISGGPSTTEVCDLRSLSHFPTPHACRE